MRRQLTLVALSSTLLTSLLLWPVLLLFLLTPLVGFLVLPTLFALSVLVILSSSWLVYALLAPDTAFPYSPRRCLKVARALYRAVREAWHVNLLGLALDWSYRWIMVLGSKKRDSIIVENIPYAPPHVKAPAGSQKKPFPRRRLLDVYLPMEHQAESETGEAAPVIVFIPGGGWAFSSKRYYLQLALTLRKKGNMVVIPDITLYPDGNVKDMVTDIRLVLAWVGKNAGRYGGDPASIYLMGHGSGAHLSLLTLVQEAVVRSRDSYWLANYEKLERTKKGSTARSAQRKDAFPSSMAFGESDADDSDEPLREAAARVAGGRDPYSPDVVISAGIRRLEVWGGETPIPEVKGMILMAGVVDVIKHIRAEFKAGIEQISPLKKALGPSHASCLMASPSHLIFGAKQIFDTSFLPPNILLIHGGADQSIPIVQTVLLKTLLQGVGVRNVTLKAYRDLTHLECVTALCASKKSKYSGMLLNEIVSLVARGQSA